MDTSKELVLRTERKTIKYALKYLVLKLKDEALTERQKQEYQKDLKDIMLLKSLNEILDFENEIDEEGEPNE